MSEAELEQLYSRLEKPLYNVVFRWVWSAEDAQDIVQEAFVRLWRMRERVEAETVDALVYRIALNLAASRRRSRKIWRWVALDALRGSAAGPAEGDGSLIADEERRRVRAARGPRTVGWPGCRWRPVCPSGWSPCSPSDRWRPG